jgi:hypothetical protein
MEKETTSELETVKIDPLSIYRYEEGHRIFGYKPTQLDELIKQKVIPAPMYLGPPPSRAKGWTGAQLIKYFKELEEAQAERAAAAKKVYEQKLIPGQKKPKAEEKPKVKKRKLIPPRKAKG